MEINAGRGLDLFRSEFGQDMKRAPGSIAQRDGGNEDLAAGKNHAGFNRQISNRPFLIIEVEVVHRPNVRIGRADCVVPKVLRSS